MARNGQLYVSDNAQLMSEWHWEKNNALGYNPQTITYGSAKKVWWICDQKHEWEANPNHRSRGRGCPVCAEKQRRISKAKNIVTRRGSLADNNPTLASQWHPSKNASLTPQNITINSPKRVWWMCEKGHEWEAPINSRNSGVGCPVCSGHKIVVGINDLATIRPDLAAEWHPTKNGTLTPQQVTMHNGKSVWWQCNKGHEWKSKIANRTYGCNCPICSGKKVLVGYNDLATVNPQLAAEWHPTKNGTLTSCDVTSFSNKNVWWQCNKGHEWQSTVSHRSSGRRCPVCFGESKTSFPEQALFFYLRQLTSAINRYRLENHTEIDVYLPEYKIGIEYDGLFFHTGEKAEQREKKKQEVLENHGILLIRVKEVKEKRANDLEKNIFYIKQGPSDQELKAVILELIAHISVLTFLSATIDVDLSRDRNQIYEQYVLAEKANSLQALNPKLAAEWHPTKNGLLSPEHVSISSNKRVWWKCAKGHEWQAVINGRRGDVGCPYCARRKK